MYTYIDGLNDQQFSTSSYVFSESSILTSYNVQVLNDHSNMALYWTT